MSGSGHNALAALVGTGVATALAAAATFVQLQSADSRRLTNVDGRDYELERELELDKHDAADTGVGGPLAAQRRVVWRAARDAASGERVSIKAIAARTRAAAAAAACEARCLRSLPEHPHLARLVSAAQRRNDDGGALVVLVFHPPLAAPLAARLAPGAAPLTAAALWEAMAHCAAALAVLAALPTPLAHRAVCAEHLRRAGNDGRWLLVEFGAATTVTFDPRDDAARSAAAADIGAHTPLACRAPEQVALERGLPINERVDVWALGTLLYRCAFFAEPFSTAAEIAAGKYEVPTCRAAMYDDKVVETIEFLLKPDPRTRPPIDIVAKRLANYHKEAVKERTTEFRNQQPVAVGQQAQLEDGQEGTKEKQRRAKSKPPSPSSRLWSLTSAWWSSSAASNDNSATSASDGRANGCEDKTSSADTESPTVAKPAIVLPAAEQTSLRRTVDDMEKQLSVAQKNLRDETAALRRALNECAQKDLQIATLKAKVAELENALSHERAAAAAARRIDYNLLDFGCESERERVVLGRGATAIVYAAHYNGTPVAVKELIANRGEDAIADALRAELELLHCVSAHPHIVSVFGASATSNLLALVMERMATSLYRVLHDESRVLSIRERLHAAAAVGRALAFCHSLSPPLLHRDVKSPNVLTSQDLQHVKLSDFGSSRLGGAVSTLTSQIGTAQWTAPEVLRGDGKYDTKADVYSLGIVAWEIFSRKVPFAELDVPALQLGMLVLMTEQRPEPAQPAAMPDSVAEIVQRCWRQEPAERPTSADVAKSLDRLLVAAVALECDAEADAKLCIICLDEECVEVLVPCGHNLFCSECATDLKLCPVCRTTVETHIRVYRES